VCVWVCKWRGEKEKIETKTGLQVKKRKRERDSRGRLETFVNGLGFHMQSVVTLLFTFLWSDKYINENFI